MTASTRPEVFFQTKKPSTSASQAEVLTWVFTNGQSIQRTSPGIYTPPWTDASIRSITNRLAELGPSITDFSTSPRLRQGTVDASSARQAATDAAIESGSGTVFYPAGSYLMNGPCINSSSVTHWGESYPAAGIGGTPQGDAIILHNFVGNDLIFNGADGSAVGTGGGVYNLRFVNIAGAPTDLCGSAIWYGAVDINHHAGNSQCSRLVICDGAGAGAFTYAVEIDMHNSIGAYGICGASNIRLDHLLTHTFGTGAVRMNGIATSMVSDCGFFDVPGSDIIVGDIDPCLETSFNNVFCGGDILFNDVGSMSMFGGIYTNIVNTANSTRDQSNLFPGKLVNPFVDLSGGKMNVVYFDGTNALVTNAGIRIQGGVATYSGTGAPAGGLGVNGDWYQRFDTPGTANQRLYVKAAGSWSGIL